MLPMLGGGRKEDEEEQTEEERETCLTLSLFTKSEDGDAKHSPSDVTSGDLCDPASEASSAIRLMMPIQRYTPKHIIATGKQLSSSFKKNNNVKK